MTLRQRQMGAIFGALVGDAAARPLHWVYDDVTMDKAISNKTDYTFLPTNVCPFYKLPTGLNSCYGDQIYATLKSLSTSKYINKFDINHWKKTLYQTFGGKNNIYQTSIKLRKKMPVDGPWLHIAMIDFCAKYELNSLNTGSRHIDNDAISCCIPVISYLSQYAGYNCNIFPMNTIKSIIESIIESPDVIIRGLFISQLLWNIIVYGECNNNIDFIKLLYKLREEYLGQNQNDNDMFKMVYNEVCDVMDDCGIIVNRLSDNNQDIDVIIDKNQIKYKTYRDVVKSDDYGKPCGNPGSFKGPLYNIIVYGNTGYKNIILNEIISGGDNCSRINISGSIIGAIYGYNAIPIEWINQTSVAKNALHLCGIIYGNHASRL